jgi:uncharacterized membrane protein YfcA
MNMTTILLLVLIGLAAGLLSSMVGIGGGIVVVPALVLLLAMNQKMAQGTSLAMLAVPIGIIVAVVNYHKSGYVNFKYAGIMCITFIAGSYLGSKFALNLPEAALKKIFGTLLFLLSIKFLFFSK